MAFVENILTPILQMIVYVMLTGGLCFGIYFAFKRFFPDFKWTLKYKVFRKKFNEEKVKFCLDAWENNIHPYDIKKNMLISGKTFAEVDEMLYIYNQVENNMKGGVRK